MKAYVSELFGTFFLVFIGCGSVVLGDFGALIPTGGALAIAFAFGIAVVAMAYAVGPVSGAHLNPAVTLGAFLAGRLPARDVAPYMAAQVVGGVLGALVLWIIATGAASGAPTNLAANGWSDYSTAAAFIAEMVATFIFVMVILGVTAGKHITVMAGLVIGLTLTAIHICFIAVTGTSVNPARSIGPALFSGGTAMAQLWLFIAAPLIGGAAAGLLYRTGVLEKTEIVLKKARA
ncbi:MIP family channel protein [Chelativorans intermedius]|uniref:MIP family channel protein n=1 Tax=Chelativorans intermedius TaxID=515947 RepID=A0ABV6DD84_9HYPH|nr:MIP family channel protein [Chelativorans intermedius]MCT8999744.1 MIP family channel protein [Chelativorans intermedius]